MRSLFRSLQASYCISWRPLIFLTFFLNHNQLISAHIECDGCYRLFYELQFNFSLPCLSSIKSSVRNIQMTSCIYLPNDFSRPLRGDEDPDAVLVHQLELFELDEKFHVVSQEIFRVSIETGGTFFLESAAPSVSRALQVVASGLDLDQQAVVKSWTVHFGELCVESSLKKTSGWAELTVACDRTATTPAPSTPSVKLSASRSKPAKGERSRFHRHNFQQ